MRSLKESLILELSSDLLSRAHDKQVARNGGKESNRSRRFATAAGKALTRELLSGVRGGKIVNTVKELSTNAAFVSATEKDAIEMKQNLEKENYKYNDDTDAAFYVPNYKVTDGGNSVVLTGGNKKINAPTNKFFIYKDKYHDCLHIACREDIRTAIGYNPLDYEDFSQNDILGSYNTVYDAVIAALKMVHKNITDEDIAELKNVEDEEDDAFKYSKFIFQGSKRILGRDFYDSNDFVIKVLKGEYGNEDVIWKDCLPFVSMFNECGAVYTNTGNKINYDGTIEK